MNKKKVIIISMITLILGGMLLILLSEIKKIDGILNISSANKKQEIFFDKINTKLYLQAETRSIAGNHEEIVLSSSPLKEGQKYLKDECYVFFTSDLYYKKQGIDSLLIYVGSSSISEPPKKFIDKIKIIIVELKNYDEVRDYDLNYKKYGLSKISVNTDN